MPELPEVEHIRRTLEPVLVGATVVSATVHRRDVVTSSCGTARGRQSSRGRIDPAHLLAGTTIARLHRHGKNLAIIATPGRRAGTGGVVCIHLGMSGQLRFVPHGQRLEQTDHVHVQWKIERHSHAQKIYCRGAEDAEKDFSSAPSSAPQSVSQSNSPLSVLRAPAVDFALAGGTLVFRDPRRFGGIWLFDSLADLESIRFADLGPDALTIDGSLLASRLNGSSRSIKAALLDQAVIAGVGNIYADEALFRAGIHPAKSARLLKASQLDALAAAVVEILNAAIASGGSTIRSYVDSTGQGGSFAERHMVYGRAGQPCLRCRVTLRHTTVCQRTTTFCPRCQSRSGTHNPRSYPQSNNTALLSRSKSSRASVSVAGVVGRQAQRRRRVLVSSSS